MKKIAKFHLSFALSLVLVAAFFAFPAPSLNARSVVDTFVNAIGTRAAPRRPATIGLEITGEIPHVQFSRNNEFAQLGTQLNERFMAQYNAFVQSHLTSALSIHFTAEIFTSYDFVSVVLTKAATSASVTAAVSTTVINATTGEIIALPDFNVNILQLINNYLDDIISANPRGFVSDFGGVDSSHPFFLDEDRLIIPFGSAELIPDARTIEFIELSISNIQNEFLDDDYFIILPPSQYNTIMIRLADVMRRFGYDVEWIAETRTVNVLSDDEIVSSVTIGENAYFYRDRSARELEMAPMASNEGRAYVPLSFFSEVLGIPTTVSPDGYIVMSRYHRLAYQGGETAEELPQSVFIPESE